MLGHSTPITPTLHYEACHDHWDVCGVSLRWRPPTTHQSQRWFSRHRGCYRRCWRCCVILFACLFLFFLVTWMRWQIGFVVPCYPHLVTMWPSTSAYMHAIHHAFPIGVGDMGAAFCVLTCVSIFCRFGATSVVCNSVRHQFFIQIMEGLKRR